VSWATSVPILIYLDLSVLQLGPMYATDRQTSDRRQTKASLNASTLWRRRHNSNLISIAPYGRNLGVSVFKVASVMDSLLSLWQPATDSCVE